MLYPITPEQRGNLGHVGQDRLTSGVPGAGPEREQRCFGQKVASCCWVRGIARANRIVEVEVYISALRTKIDRGFSQKLIRTIRGIGYTFTSANSAPLELNTHGKTLHPEDVDHSARQRQSA